MAKYSICVTCSGVVYQLPEPLTRVPTWYHSNSPLDGQGEPSDHEPIPV